ncbi:MAG TPA: hypothetical protein VJV79_09200 [Polyangiaceae bacterium]|nr:hypothetical protein [Polyangiaceae bacterium]
MVWRRLFGGFEAMLGALLLASCASSGFEGGVYRDGDVHFRVGPIPNSWRRLDVEDARLAFRDDSANATVAVNGRCGLDGDDVPLTSLTQHLFLQFSERQPIAQTKLSLDGREALRTEIIAALDGVKKQYLVYVLKKNNCVYDFMYIAEGSAPGSRADFERFVQGFAALE